MVRTREALRNSLLQLLEEKPAVKFGSPNAGHPSISKGCSSAWTYAHRAALGKSRTTIVSIRIVAGPAGLFLRMGGGIAVT